jgi:ABC-2 type transport system permease protein
MIRSLLKFELNYHFRQVSFLITAFVFFALAGFAAAKGGFGGPDVYRNSPFVINNIIALFSLFTIFAGTLFSANVVLRDSLHQMESIVFSTSIKTSTYFWTRFSGLLIAVASLLVFALLGIALGALFVKSEELGPFGISYFLNPLIAFGIPNAFFASSFLFATAMLTKNVRAIYTTGVLLYILYMVAGVLGNSPLFATSEKLTDPGILPFLVDPFGLASFFYDTRKWSDLQRNIQLFPLSGSFLVNRILWISFSCFLLLISFRFFSFRLSGSPKTRAKKVKPTAFKVLELKSTATQPTGYAYQILCFRSQFKLEVISLFKHIPFAVMLLLWIFFFAMELKDSLKGPYGIDFYATTGYLVQEMQSLKFALVLLIFYAAEVIAREKSTNFQSLVYSTPVGNGAMYFAKCLTLVVLVITLVTINICIGLGVQLTYGFSVIDWGTYLSLYYYSGFPIILFVVLILFIQNLACNKYVGMLLSMIVVFIVLFASRFGITHYLLRFAATPALQFSYFNDFGVYAESFNWYMLYWFGFALVLAVFSIAWWQKGSMISFLSRLKTGKTLGQMKVVLCIALLLFIGSGSFIYYQTNVTGEYETNEAQLKKKVEYEQKYAALILIQPIIKKVKIEVDLFPEAHKYVVRGQYLLRNESKQLITKLWVNFDQSVNKFAIRVPNGNNEPMDDFKHQFVSLKNPLQPGEEMPLYFSFEVTRSGFVPFDPENSVVDNGSYIELEKFVPSFGYDTGKALTDSYTRKQNGLTPLKYVSSSDLNLHLVDFEGTIAVPLDQQAITVGTLEKTWKIGDRRYFHYRTVQPINFMFALSAARYELKHQVVNGISLNLYTLPGHAFNTKSVMNALADALIYGHHHFSPYTASQLTLAEIPHYKGAATAYPGVIFSAEAITFLADYTNPTHINQSYVLYTHEVAHQWWANQLVPNRGPGYAMLTESLAKYTEYMLLEKRFGKMHLRQFLKQEHDLYFLDHQSENNELPLVKTFDQNYVHYQKGGLIFYAVKEMIGEQALNKVLKEFIQRHRVSMIAARPEDLVADLLKVVPDEQKSTIKDFFTQVVTYTLAVKVVGVKKIANEQYQVDLRINADKNIRQKTTKEPLYLTIDLAFFDQIERDWNKDLKPFYLRKQVLKDGTNELSVILKQKPKVVSIDPYAYLLDTNLEDNMEVIK